MHGGAQFAAAARGLYLRPFGSESVAARYGCGRDRSECIRRPGAHREQRGYRRPNHVHGHRFIATHSVWDIGGREVATRYGEMDGTGAGAVSRDDGRAA